VFVLVFFGVLFFVTFFAVLLLGGLLLCFAVFFFEGALGLLLFLTTFFLAVFGFGLLAFFATFLVFFFGVDFFVDFLVPDFLDEAFALGLALELTDLLLVFPIGSSLPGFFEVGSLGCCL